MVLFHNNCKYLDLAADGAVSLRWDVHPDIRFHHIQSSLLFSGLTSCFGDFSFGSRSSFSFRCGQTFQNIPWYVHNHTWTHWHCRRSKTSVSRLMMKMQRPWEVIISLRRVLVVQRRSNLQSASSDSVYVSLFLPDSSWSSAGSSVLRSSALGNGFQIDFSLCCDQAIKTPAAEERGWRR